MKKKTIFIISLIVVVMTGLMILVGNNFAKEDHEKQKGYSNVFTLSSTDKLAYVQYSDGKPMLFIANQNGELAELIDERTEFYTISDLSFSNDGKKLLYIVNKKDLESNTSELLEYDLENYTKQTLFVQEDSIITEATYAPDGESLYILGAGTFENYSPIAAKNPHDFNIFQYHLATEQLEQITQLDSYSINSLAVSQNGEKLYFIQDGVTDPTTAEEVFSSKMRIFELALSDSNNLTIVDTLKQDVNDFAFSPDEKELIIQAVAGTDDNGTFMYELFSYNLETKEEKQLTHLNEYAGRPVYSSDGSKVYFIVDFNFAGYPSEYAIHYLNTSNNNVVRIPESRH